MGKIGLSATPQEIALASAWIVQIVHTDEKGVKHYGPFGDEDAAEMWMVTHGPANTLFTVIPLFDRIW